MTHYGIDVGGTGIKIGRFEQGILTEKQTLPTDIREGGRFILSHIADRLGPANGFVLAVPGPILSDGRVNGCTNLGWGLCNPAEALSDLCGIPGRCCNDAEAAALGESWQGAARDYRSSVTVTLGTGIGAGIVLNHQLFSGAAGAAGEIGHLCINPKEAEPCSCGLHGCLEQYASATGLARLGKQAGLGALNAREIADRAKAGDAGALRVLDTACDCLGRGLAMVACTLDPELFVLAGGLAGAGEILRSKTEAAFQTYAFHACRHTKIRLSVLGGEAGMYGAGKLAMDSFS